MNIEDAGFDIRHMMIWAYGSGFPKSHDISKALDRKRDDRDSILIVTTFMAEAAERLGISRADIDQHMGTSDMGGWWLSRLRHRCQCPKPDQWERLVDFLKLSSDIHPPISLDGESFTFEDVAREVHRLNERKGEVGEAWLDRPVLGSEVKTDTTKARPGFSGAAHSGDGANATREVDITAPATDAAKEWEGWGTALKPAIEPIVLARKPIPTITTAENVLRHGTGALNIDASRVPGGRWPSNLLIDGSPEALSMFPMEGGESASRFFYVPKPDKVERGKFNLHPTVKPVDLMKYLVTLVTPPGGIVLDPFVGSGTTLMACKWLGFKCLGVEREAEYLPWLVKRVASVTQRPLDLFTEEDQ